MASIKYLQSDVWAENQYFTSVKFFGPKQVTRPAQAQRMEESTPSLERNNRKELR